MHAEHQQLTHAHRQQAGGELDPPRDPAGIRRASSAVTALTADHSSSRTAAARLDDAEGQAEERREVRRQRDHPDAGGQRADRRGHERGLAEQREVEHRVGERRSTTTNPASSRTLAAPRASDHRWGPAWRPSTRPRAARSCRRRAAAPRRRRAAGAARHGTRGPALRGQRDDRPRAGRSASRRPASVQPVEPGGQQRSDGDAGAEAGAPDAAGVGRARARREGRGDEPRLTRSRPRHRRPARPQQHEADDLRARGAEQGGQRQEQRPGHEGRGGRPGWSSERVPVESSAAPSPIAHRAQDPGAAGGAPAEPRGGRAVRGRRAAR